VILKPGQSPRLRLIGIDRLGFVVAAAGMGDVVDAAAERSAVPGINQVKCQRRMDRDGRMPEAGCQALKRTAATASPGRPVDVIGMRRPLQVTT
jgi:hypothetical protein